MTKNFRLKQFARYRRAINGNKPAMATRYLMNGTRNEFFAGTCFTKDKYASWCIRYNINQIFQLFGWR